MITAETLVEGLFPTWFAACSSACPGASRMLESAGKSVLLFWLSRCDCGVFIGARLRGATRQELLMLRAGPRWLAL
jgi:hypothetical protein